MSDPWKRKEVIGDCTLYLGDCLKILPSLQKFDAVVTDPPYGINMPEEMSKIAGTKYGKGAAKRREYEADAWDGEPISNELLTLTIASGKHAIIFGGNYYLMPPSRCWLVWDKEINGQWADAELAWTNLDKPVKLLRHMWNGMLRKGQEERNIHPTQKPLSVMKWCITQLPKQVNTVIDPFMGSGTTGVAACEMGKAFAGIEREEKFFEVACERIRNSHKQPDMFVEALKPPEQVGMDF